MKDEQSKSEFNAGIAKLMRIDGYKKQAYSARINRNWNLWIDSLKEWRSEMVDRMVDEQLSKAEQYERIIDGLISFKNNSRVSGLIYDKLDSYGIYLNKLEYEFGLGMPDKESTWDDWDE